MAIKSCLGLVAVVLALVVDTGSSRAAEPEPYTDSVEAVITDAFPVGANHVLLAFDVIGEGTPHVGPFTTEGLLLVDLTTFRFVGVNTLHAADGKIFIYVPRGELIPKAVAGTFIISLETVFVGGTDKFKGVKGGFSGIGDLQLPQGGGFVGATFSGEGVGTIALAKPKKK